jgi:hypothetical protein
MMGDLSSPYIVGMIAASAYSDAGTDNVGTARLNAVNVFLNRIGPSGSLGFSIHGHGIKLEACNSHVVTAANAAANMIANGAQAILTNGSSESTTVLGAAVPAHVMVMSFSATSTTFTSNAGAGAYVPHTTLPDGGLSDAGVYTLFWRTAPSDSAQGKVIAGILADGGGEAPGGTAFFYPNDAYGNSLYTEVSSDCTACGIVPYQFISKSDLTDGGTGNLSTIVQTANTHAAFSVGVIIGQGSDPGSILDNINGAVAAAPNLAGLNWFFSDGAATSSLYTPTRWSQLVPTARGTVPAPPSPDAGSLATLDFHLDYQADWGADALAYTNYTFNAYDAINLVALAADWATAGGRSYNGETLAAAITHMVSDAGPIVTLDAEHFAAATAAIESGDVNVDGASGHLDFNTQTGDTSLGPIEVWGVTDAGSIYSVQVVAP